MHRSLAVDTRHLLCYYVLSRRYSHRDEATYANCAPNSGSEEWLKNVPEQQVNTPRHHQEGPDLHHQGVTAKFPDIALFSLFLFFFGGGEIQTVSGAGLSLAGVQQRQQFINSDQGCLITSVDTAFFVKVNHVCEKLASPVHSVKSVRGNAAYRAQSQRQWLDKLPDE